MFTPRHRWLVASLIALTLGILLLTLWWQFSQNMPSREAVQSLDPTTMTTPIPTILTSDQLPFLTLTQALTATPVVDLSKLDPDQLRTIIVTGDIIPARGVDAKIRMYGPDYPFAGSGIAELLQSADMTIANLEAPLITKCPVHNEGFTFCGQPPFAAAMAKAGIDIATLENNHIGNYGQDGIEETIAHLESAGIDYATSSRLSITNIRGLKVGILAFTGVGGHFYPDSIQQRIAEANPKVDLLLVAFHWGKEYELLPTADPNIAPDDPHSIAQLAIKAGADMIIGNHPHWVQGIEFIDHQLVNYAYGNFIFDQSWSVETMQGYIGKYTYYDTKLVRVEMYPVVIESQAQPHLPSSDKAEIIRQRIAQSSHEIINRAEKD